MDGIIFPPMRVAARLALFVLITRLPALLHPRAIDDEQVYSVVATELLHGGKPYLAAVERKPPLLFYLYEGLFRLGGAYNFLALHLAAVAWTLATMALLYVIARRLFDPATGVAAAFLYGLFQAWGDYRNLALNGELLMNLPVVAAYAITLGPSRSRLRPELAIAGALVAVAFFLKQPSGIAALPLGLYLLLPSYRDSRGLTWWHSVVQAVLLTLGFALGFIAMGIHLAREGILHEALYWTVLSQEAAFGVTSWVYWDRALSDTAFFAVSTLPLLLLAGRSLAERDRWAAQSPELAALIMFLMVSVVGVGANGQFLYHYYLQLLPALALLAAPVLTEVWRETRSMHSGVFTRRVYIPWLAASAVIFLAVGSVGLWRNRESTEAGLYLREHSLPDERIFVWGQGDRLTGIYLDARRRPASRYIASFPLTGHIFGSPVSWDPAYDTSDRIVPGAWDNLRQDFEAHPPRYIIDTDAVRRVPVYRIEKYPFLRDYLAEGYREVHRTAEGIIYERTAGT